MDRVRTAPDVWGDVWPVNEIDEYLITTDQMAAFIEAKASTYCPGTKVRILPFFTEARKGSKLRSSYAAPLVMISDNVQIKKGADWLVGFAEEENPQVERRVWGNIVSLYKFDRRDLIETLRTPKLMDELEETRGMTEQYIRTLLEYATVRPQKTGNDRWLAFAASPDAILKDMLRRRDDKTFHGRFEAKEVVKISDTIVAYQVYVHLNEKEESPDNPELRQILSRMYGKK